MWAMGLAVLGAATFAQAETPVRDTLLIGLVEVPALFGVLEPDKPVPTLPNRVRPINLRAKPSLDSDVVFRVETPESIEAHEHGYEHLSAVVYAIRDGWYLVSYAVKDRQGKGWLSAVDAGQYRSLAELLKNGLAYLTPEWDGRLFAFPMEDARAQNLSNGKQDPDIIVADDRQDDDGRDWFLVIVLGHGRCGALGYPPVVAAGWVPGHSRQGKLQAWFYSRGC
jgi:hypothetical protein